MSANRYLPAARQVAMAFPGILAELGLKPFISRYVLTETLQGNAWLFVVLEVDPQNDSEEYSGSFALHYLSFALNGLPVVVSESYGLRYAVLLGSAAVPGFLPTGGEVLPLAGGYTRGDNLTE
jgi:hypothetical protein